MTWDRFWGEKNVYRIAPLQSLDLEIALLRNGADVFAADVRGRLPLHYCFVKIGAHADRARSDPIEICSMIVEAMRGKGRVITDVRTELVGVWRLRGFAGKGGQNSLKIMRTYPYVRPPKEIDARDEFLSTPLHYAAFRGAAVCCLLLLECNSTDFSTDSSRSQEFLVYRVSQNAVDIQLN